MVRREKTKTTALILTAICIIVYTVSSIFDGFTIENVAVSRDCSVLARLSYSFFHASLAHTVINCWCLLSVVFIYDVPLAYLTIAYLIATCVPNVLLSTIPTVGMSAVCFSLMGMVSFQSMRKWFFHAWVLSFIVASTLLPLLCSACGYDIAAPNTPLHIYGYVAGLMVGYLNSPAHEGK